MITESEKYISQHSSPISDTLAWLERQTHLRTNYSRMLSGPEAGRLLETFSRMMQPSRILELGTFTGYSSICLASGLAPDGRLDTIEINDELEDLIHEGFARAGLEGSIRLMLGDARAIIPTLDEIYDLVYIDAAKKEYCEYLHLLRDKVRRGGYVIADNVLWDGKVWSSERDIQTQSIRAFNDEVIADEAFESFILPVRDGLNILRRI